MDVPTVALLRLAYHVLSAEIGEAVSAIAPDGRPSHGNVMEQLAYEDGARLTDLARGAGMSPQSIGELVDQLEALGYVERQPDANDRRAKRIYQTAKGKRANSAAVAATAKTEADLAALLGRVNVERLRADLIKLIVSKGGTIRPLARDD